MFCCARRHRPHRVRGRRVRSKEGVRTAQGGVRRRESLPLPPRAAHARTRAHAEPQTASPRTGRHCLRSLLCRPVSDRPTRRDTLKIKILFIDRMGSVRNCGEKSAVALTMAITQTKYLASHTTRLLPPQPPHHARSEPPPRPASPPPPRRAPRRGMGHHHVGASRQRAGGGRRCPAAVHLLGCQQDRVPSWYDVER